MKVECRRQRVMNAFIFLSNPLLILRQVVLLLEPYVSINLPRNDVAAVSGFIPDSETPGACRLAFEGSIRSR